MAGVAAAAVGRRGNVSQVCQHKSVSRERHLCCWATNMLAAVGAGRSSGSWVSTASMLTVLLLIGLIVAAYWFNCCVAGCVAAAQLV